MPYCLIPSLVKKFKRMLVDGTIDPAKLNQMTSKQRNEFFTKIVGATDAKNVNALFESKLLLKNQKAGMITWAKTITGINKTTRRDILSTIERLDGVLDPKAADDFLNDLANKRLGIDITLNEAKVISKMSSKIKESGAKMNKDFTFNNKTDELNHGLNLAVLKDYTIELKKKTSSSLLETIKKNPFNIIIEAGGAMKSVVASLDNSFQLRQGIKVLMRRPDIWAKNFMKSWGDIGRELKGIDAMLPAKAEILGRKNNLNGKYKLGKFDLDILGEEAFPSSLPGKIPIFGRLFKASESAYNAAALRMRADMADMMIDRAEKQGIDTFDKFQAESIGKLVNAMTGRGNLGKAEVISRELNVLLFSAKFAKSNFDTLTLHAGQEMSSFARKEAAKNLALIVGEIGTVMAVANMLNPNSVEFDPRSSNFGKIRIGNTRFDITGGMGSIITLASRIAMALAGLPAIKSSTTGVTTKLNEGWGSPTGMDLWWGFVENKFSPLMGIFRDLVDQEVFGGKKVTPKEIAKGLRPIILQEYESLKEDDNSANLLLGLIADGLGISVNTYSYGTNWETSTGKEITQFKEKVGEEEFKKANEEYNKKVDKYIVGVRDTKEYKDLTNDEKKELLSWAKAEVKKKIFKEYDFKYKRD